MKKNKLEFIFLILISFLSCNEKKIARLNEQILELEVQNQKLVDSIKKSQYYKIENADIIGLTFEPSFRIGEESRVRFIFNYPEKIFPYDVYTTAADGRPDQLVFSNLTENHFDYDFIPDKAGEHQIELVTVFKMKDSVTTEYYIPTNLFVEIKK